MASKQDVLKLLRLFSERKKNPVLPFSELVSYVQRYAEQKKKDNPEKEQLGNDNSKNEESKRGHF